MPISRTTTVISVAWIMFWVLMVSVAIQDYQHNDHGHDLWKPILWETSSMVVATVLMLLQRHYTRAQHGLLAKPWRWFGLQALWLPVYWLAFVPLAFGIRHSVYALAGSVYTHRPWPELFFYEGLKITVFIGLFTVIRFGILSYHELLEEKLRAEQSNALLRQAQLQQLTQQMQPHFLFNALNMVSSLMHSDVEKADAVLIQLADVLRATLDISDRHEAPLDAELRLVRAYARVMEERYAERVAIAWHIDDAALACKVPVMSVQPLLENIFKHTVEQRRHLTRISISAMLDGESLVLRLDDDCGTLAGNASPGIGLKNLRERLSVMYGERASLALVQLEPAGVRAEMRLPCAS